MTIVHVAVGSNIDPERHVPAAFRHIANRWGAVDHSPFYLTQAIDRPWQAPYWNGVLRFDSDASRVATQQALRKIEADEGRVRSDDPYDARTLDLDLLLWEGRPASNDALEDLRERSWLALALASLEPDFELDGEPLAEHAEALPAHELAPWP